MADESRGTYTEGTNTNSLLTVYSNDIAFVGILVEDEYPELLLHAPTNVTTLDLFMSTNLLVTLGWTLPATLDHIVDPILWTYPGSESPAFFASADADADQDSDGMADGREVRIYGTSTNAADSDGDGLNDGVEILTYGLDPLNEDTDGDGLSDGDEIEYGANPTDTDTDGDGMGDGAEVAHGNCPTSVNSYATLPFYENFELFDELRGDSGADNFGCSAAVYSNTLAIGAYDPAAVTNSFVYVYEWGGDEWVEQAKIPAPSGATNFGSSVSLHDDHILVGAYTEGNKGAAHIYERTGTNWSHKAKLTASDAANNDYFGYAVAVHGETALVGAFRNNSYDGSAYVFTISGTNWVEATNMVGTTDSQFGFSVASSDSRLVVGAKGGSTSSGPQGYVYVYSWDGTNCALEQKVGPEVVDSSSDDDSFGYAVSIHGTSLAVGCPTLDWPLLNVGAVYIYSWNGSQWTNEVKRQASDLAAYENFGRSVCIHNDTVVAGSYGDDQGADSGAAYAFVYDGTNWIQEIELAPPVATTTNDLLGASVAVFADRMVAGAQDCMGGDSQRSGAVFSLSVTNYVALLDADMLLSGYHSWSVSEADRAFIKAAPEPVHGGYGSLVLTRSFPPVEIAQYCAATGLTNIWIDSHSRFSPSNEMPSAESPSIAGFPGWVASAYGMNTNGNLVAYDGLGNNTWRVVTNATVSSDTFHRYTVKQDYVNKTWDLYFDGTNVLTGLGFRSTNVPEFSCFSLSGKWNGLTYIDDIYIGTVQPDGLSE